MTLDAEDTNACNDGDDTYNDDTPIPLFLTLCIACTRDDDDKPAAIAVKPRASLDTATGQSTIHFAGKSAAAVLMCPVCVGCRREEELSSRGDVVVCDRASED